VRASAVSALAKFGVVVEELRPRILILLRRCLYDNDDEVRDRATLYLSLLSDGPDAIQDDPQAFLSQGLDVPLANLEASLQSYEPSERPFDLAAVPKDVKSHPQAEKKAPTSREKKAAKDASQKAAANGGASNAFEAYEKLLNSIPQFAAFGKLFKSSAPVELTEAETEYAVSVVKHVYPGHIVFQFNCTNTIAEQLLENVSIVMEFIEGEDFNQVATKPLASMPCGVLGQAFVAFEKPEGACSLGKFSNTLRFDVKEVDPSTGDADEEGYEDEYQLEDSEVTAADYILKAGVSNFRNAWDSLDAELERVDEYSLGMRESLQDAVQAVTAILGMQTCEATDVVPSNARSHTCLLAGKFLGDIQVLVRLSLGIDSQKQVAMKLAVRSEDPAVSDIIHEIINS